MHTKGLRDLQYDGWPTLKTRETVPSHTPLVIANDTDYGHGPWALYEWACCGGVCQ